MTRPGVRIPSAPPPVPLHDQLTFFHYIIYSPPLMDASKLRPGHRIVFEGQPYTVVSSQLRQQPRLATKMIVKLKHLITGAVVEHTWTGGDHIVEADVENVAAKYLYNDGENYVFMDNATFEQFEFSKAKIGDSVDFLKDDADVYVMRYNGEPINIDLPPTVQLKVIEAEPGVKGDSATGKMKQAKLETGVTIQVPLFIEEGEEIIVNTQTREYRERVK